MARAGRAKRANKKIRCIINRDVWGEWCRVGCFWGDGLGARGRRAERDALYGGLLWGVWLDASTARVGGRTGHEANTEHGRSLSTLLRNPPPSHPRTHRRIVKLPRRHSCPVYRHRGMCLSLLQTQTFDSTPQSGTAKHDDLPQYDWPRTLRFFLFGFVISE